MALLKFMLVYFTGPIYRPSDLPCEINGFKKYLSSKVEDAFHRVDNQILKTSYFTHNLPL